MTTGSMTELKERIEKIESDLIVIQQELARMNVAMVEVTKFVSRTLYNRITRLTKRVKELG